MQKYLSVEDVRERLRSEAKQAGSMSAWAANNDFSKAFVSYVLRGQREPSKRLLEILGIREVRVYVEENDVQPRQ